MNCIKNERIKNEIIKNERIKNERIKNELIKKELIRSELGTQQFCRDNVTMLSGPQLFVIAILLYLLWLPHLVPEAILRCRVVVVTKLKNCHVPSSAKPIYMIF